MLTKNLSILLIFFLLLNFLSFSKVSPIFLANISLGHTAKLNGIGIYWTSEYVLSLVETFLPRPEEKKY